MYSISALLFPRSIAIIGASPDTAILRGKVQHLLQGWRFPGAIYPVSRTHQEVQGLKAYRSVAEIPDPIDAAVLIIPALDVPEALEACGRAGVRAAYIVSSGFAEDPGQDGAKLQADIRDIAARHRMAVCGPNGEGFMNALIPVVATFAAQVENFDQPLLPETPRGRTIAVISQSGGIGFSLYHRGRPRQLRIGYVVSTGNEAVLDSFAFVDWCLDEGRADVVLLYMETIRDVETFRRVAEKAADLGKPLIVAKMGRSSVGARAAASHTAALAGSDAAYDAVFRRYGVIRAYDINQQLDMAAAFAYCPLPQGRRVAVLAGSGGSGVWMSDTLAVQGLDLPVLDDETRAAIDRLIPSFGSSANPIDLTAQAVRAVGYAKITGILLGCPLVDCVVIVGSLTYPATLRRDAEALAHLTRTSQKPIVFCTYTLASAEAIGIAANAGLPVFTSMPGCAAAISAMADYRQFLDMRAVAAPLESAGDGTADAAARRSATLARLASQSIMLGEYDAKAVLEPFGVPRADESLVSDRGAAVLAAERIGYPVALKVDACGLAHKTEAGGVALRLASAAAVEAAYDAMMARLVVQQPLLDIRGVLVQPMARPGIETVVGISRDGDFGPMLLVGLGGIHVEILQDVALAPAPLDMRQAQALLGRLRGYKILEGARGQPPADIAALCQLMVAVSRFATEFAEEVVEIDLNPVIVHPVGEGLTVVDALIVKRGTSTVPSPEIGM